MRSCGPMTRRAFSRTARLATATPRTQPIWLTERPENPNGATMLVLVDGVAAERPLVVCALADLFDGNDPAAVEAARGRWRRAAAAGHTLTYWQQTAAGWENKDKASGVAGAPVAAGRGHGYKPPSPHRAREIMAIERTLSIIKPDATRRNLTGAINQRFEATRAAGSSRRSGCG